MPIHNPVLTCNYLLDGSEPRITLDSWHIYNLQMPLSVAGAVAALALPLATTTMEMTPVKYRGWTVSARGKIRQERNGTYQR